MHQILKKIHLKSLLAAFLAALLICNKNYIFQYLAESKVDKFRNDIVFLSSLLPIICEAETIRNDYNSINLISGSSEHNRALLEDIGQRMVNVYQIADDAPARNEASRNAKRVVLESLDPLRQAGEDWRNIFSSQSSGTTSALSIVNLVSSSAPNLLRSYPRTLERLRDADEKYEAYLFEQIENAVGQAGITSETLNTNERIELTEAIKERLLQNARRSEIFAQNEGCLYNKLNEIELELDAILLGESISARLPIKMIIKPHRNNLPLNLLNQPSRRSRVVGQIQMKEEIILLEIREEYGRVEHPTLGTGWIKNPLLHTKPLIKRHWFTYLYLPLSTLLFYFLIQATISFIRNKQIFLK